MERARYVTAYAVTRCYGGPEEGGWWYNRYRAVHTLPVKNERRAERVQAKFLKRFGEIAEGDIYSVHGGVELTVIKESEYRAYETRSRPRYE